MVIKEILKRWPMLPVYVSLASLTLSLLVVQFFLFQDFYLSAPADLKTEPGKHFNQYSGRSFEAVLDTRVGGIPILEYHIIETPAVYEKYIKTGRLKKNRRTDRYYVTTEEFRGHLQALHERNFRNISLDEYLSLKQGLRKTLDRLPPDCRLYVITFDDASFGQFDFISNGVRGPVVDPDCAVGVMVDFAREHPEFKLNAAFNVDFENPPFLVASEVTKKLNMLLDLGFEIVNHTASHKKMSVYVKTKPELAAREIGRAMELFESHLGYRANTVDKICYPDGSADEKVWEFVRQVPYNGKVYHFVAALDATGLAAKNPNDSRFRPYNIARIETSKYSFDKFILNAPGLFKTPPQLEESAYPNYVLYHSPQEQEMLDLVRLKD